MGLVGLLFEFDDVLLELGLEEFAVGYFCCSEVDEFEVAAFAEHQVFGLSEEEVPSGLDELLRFRGGTRGG